MNLLAGHPNLIYDEVLEGLRSIGTPKGEAAEYARRAVRRAEARKRAEEAEAAGRILLDPLEGIQELAAIERASWKSGLRDTARGGREPMASEDIFYTDALKPHLTANVAAVTLAATSKDLLATAVNAPTKGADYWWPGKLLHFLVLGQITTAATPGNLTVEIRLATTDAGGTLLATSAALTLIASQTNITWRADYYVRCRAVGSGTSGSLLGWGKFEVGTAVVAAGQALIPASAPAAVGVDTTAASGISFQAKRSGSTAETMQVVDLLREATN